MFYLVLPADWKKKDAEAEVFSLSRDRSGSIRYQSASDLKGSGLGSIQEDEEADEGEYAGLGSAGSGWVNGDDNSSTSSPGSKSKSSRKSPLRKTFQKIPIEEQEVIYQYRVLLDGNEKFIWLQAAAELNRLSSDGAVSLVSTTVDVTK